MLNFKTLGFGLMLNFIANQVFVGQDNDQKAVKPSDTDGQLVQEKCQDKAGQTADGNGQQQDSKDSVIGAKKTSRGFDLIKNGLIAALVCVGAAFALQGFMFYAYYYWKHRRLPPHDALD